MIIFSRESRASSLRLTNQAALVKSTLYIPVEALPTATAVETKRGQQCQHRIIDTLAIQFHLISALNANASPQ